MNWWTQPSINGRKNSNLNGELEEEKKKNKKANIKLVDLITESLNFLIKWRLWSILLVTKIWISSYFLMKRQLERSSTLLWKEHMHNYENNKKSLISFWSLKIQRISVVLIIEFLIIFCCNHFLDIQFCTVKNIY